MSGFPSKRNLGSVKPRSLFSLDATLALQVQESSKMGRLITKKELSIVLSVSPRTIETWVRNRRIPAYKLGRRCTRFNLRAVLEALDQFKQEALQR